MHRTRGARDFRVFTYRCAGEPRELETWYVQCGNHRARAQNSLSAPSLAEAASQRVVRARSVTIMEPFEDRRVQHADTPTRPRRTFVSSRVVGLYEYFIRKARVTSPRYTRSFTDEKEAWHDVGERKLGSVGFVGDVEVGLPLREKSERGEILNI